MGNNRGKRNNHKTDGKQIDDDASGSIPNQSENQCRSSRNLHKNNMDNVDNNKSETVNIPVQNSDLSCNVAHMDRVQG
jgi:hypothetical protein